MIIAHASYRVTCGLTREAMITFAAFSAMITFAAEVKNGGSDLLRAYRLWFRIGQSEDGGHDIGGRLPAIADPPNDFQHS